jgi:hypothetical protein
MSFVENVKNKVGDVVGKAADEHRAEEEKSESDIESDSGVAGSRANDDGEDGSYVGRTNPQFDAETQESGAEARAEADRTSHDG